MARRFSGVSGLCAVVLLCLVVSVPATADWPGFRGPNHDGRGSEPGALAGENLSLSLGWKRDLGSGYSAIAVVGTRVVTMFATPESDVVAAFDSVSGDELWRYAIAETYKGHSGSHDGPVSTPLIADNRVYGLGPRGHLFAVNLEDGSEVWVKDLAAEHGATAPYYGFSTSPLMAEGVLVVEMSAEEGRAVAGFNPADGALLWTTGDDNIEYHSPIVVRIEGEAEVIAPGQKHIYGLDPATGDVLWSYEHGGDARAIGGMTIVPLPAGEGRFFLMNKADSSLMLSVTRKRKKYKIEELWSGNALKNSYVPPVYHDGYIYGMSNRIFTCLDAATGDIKWRSRQPGDGFPIIVGDRLVIITKPGTLHVAKASPEGYQELASLELFSEHSWSEVSWSGGHIYARSMAKLARIDAAAAAAPVAGDADAAGATGFAAFLAQVAAATDKTAMVDAFMAEQKRFPVVEPMGDVHFLYRGEAQDVGIVGDMIGFRREEPLTRVPGTDLFYYSTRLEPDAAVSYGFIVDYAEPAPDSLNKQQGEGLFGDVSWMAMPARRAPDYLGDAPAERQGTMQTLTWESATLEGRETTVEVYLPAGYDPEGSRRYPVLYLHDGKSALEGGMMKNALDNLIGAVAQPLIAVFIIPDEENPIRGDEDMEKHMAMLTGELIPRIDKDFVTIAEAAGRGTSGVARSAGMALDLAFEHPELISRVGTQSAMLNVSDLTELATGPAEKPMVIYLDWGTYHMRSPHEAWDLAKSSREAWAYLRQVGYRPAGGELPEGFGWKCWSGHTDSMLAALFPLGE